LWYASGLWLVEDWLWHRRFDLMEWRVRKTRTVTGWRAALALRFGDEGAYPEIHGARRILWTWMAYEEEGYGS